MASIVAVTVSGYLLAWSDGGPLTYSTWSRSHCHVLWRSRELRLRQRNASRCRRGETILLAEDDDALRRLAQATLEELGYTVLAACDGLDALEIEDEFDGEIDMLLTDVVMPGLNGYDLLRTIKKTRPHIKVVVISGYPARGDLKLIDPPKDVQVLQKPVDPNTLAPKNSNCSGPGRVRANHTPPRPVGGLTRTIGEWPCLRC